MVVCGPYGQWQGYRQPVGAGYIRPALQGRGSIGRTRENATYRNGKSEGCGETSPRPIRRAFACVKRGRASATGSVGAVTLKLEARFLGVQGFLRTPARAPAASESAGPFWFSFGHERERKGSRGVEDAAPYNGGTALLEEKPPIPPDNGVAPKHHRPGGQGDGGAERELASLAPREEKGQKQPEKA